MYRTSTDTISLKKYSLYFLYIDPRDRDHRGGFGDGPRRGGGGFGDRGDGGGFGNRGRGGFGDRRRRPY